MTRKSSNVKNQDIDKAAGLIGRSLSKISPTLAVVLGSGFKDVAGQIEQAVSIPYARIPGFQRSKVSGHAGKLVAGKLGGTEVILLCGRSHYYEGYSMAEITFPVHLLALLGITDVLLTNAAGGINKRFRPGDFMALTDHINLMTANPLRPVAAGGQPPEFLDLSEVYDPVLGKMIRKSAKKTKARLHSGVYLAVSGPTYETPAEIRAYKRLGADAVGMSTVPEAVIAREQGLNVAALSLITNLAAGISKNPLSHEEVLETGVAAQAIAAELLIGFCTQYGRKKT
ncbi:MAG: purine-nucleoside phosphorylase [Verrucomicrobiales bacterium]|nr:purine-nucleoside phosphorylase [Verrucomicrobiales bacterium]|tara:strand:+ start:6518 stop:7372 length:855 start_codon:yes stop_codon:yes gene_type:complete